MFEPSELLHATDSSATAAIMATRPAERERAVPRTGLINISNPSMTLAPRERYQRDFPDMDPIQRGRHGLIDTQVADLVGNADGPAAEGTVVARPPPAAGGNWGT